MICVLLHFLRFFFCNKKDEKNTDEEKKASSSRTEQKLELGKLEFEKKVDQDQLVRKGRNQTSF